MREDSEEKKYISSEDVLIAAEKEAVKQTITTREKHKNFLKYQFTEAEKKSLSEDMARNVKEKDAVVNEMKSVQGQLNGRKKQAEAAISECAEKISSGYEYRSIDCETVKDYSLGTVITRRLDTLEIVEKRKMTMTDRQMVIQEG